jgi:hypothetical protein
MAKITAMTPNETNSSTNVIPRRAIDEPLLSGRTTAVTEPPPENYDFKTRVIGGFGSPLGSRV